MRMLPIEQAALLEISGIGLAEPIEPVDDTADTVRMHAIEEEVALAEGSGAALPVCEPPPAREPIAEEDAPVPEAAAAGQRSARAADPPRAPSPAEAIVHAAAPAPRPAAQVALGALALLVLQILALSA